MFQRPCFSLEHPEQEGGREVSTGLKESISISEAGNVCPSQLAYPHRTLPNKGFPFPLVKNQNNKKGEIIILAILFSLNESTRMLQKHWRQNQALGPRDVLGGSPPQPFSLKTSTLSPHAPPPTASCEQTTLPPPPSHLATGGASQASLAFHSLLGLSHQARCSEPHRKAAWVGHSLLKGRYWHRPPSAPVYSDPPVSRRRSLGREEKPLAQPPG